MKIHTNQSPLLITCMMFILMILASSCNYSAKNLSSANLTDDIENKIESQVQNYGVDNNAKIGDELLILVGGQIYNVIYTGKKNNTAQIEDCALSICEQNQQYINEICKDFSFPAGHGILICDTNAYCCNCYCR